MKIVKLTTKYNTVFKCLCGSEKFKATIDEDGTSELHNCLDCNMYCGSIKLPNHAGKIFGNYTHSTEVKEVAK